MKVRYRKVVLFVFLLFLFGKIQTRFETPLFDDNYIILFYCGVILIAALTTTKAKIVKGNKAWWLLLGLLCLYTLLFAVLLFNPAYDSYIRQYTLAFLSFIVIVFATSYYITSKRQTIMYLKYSFVLITLVLFTCYILYFDNFANISSFWETNRARSAFGFTHANTTAEICLAAYAISIVLLSAKTDGLISLSKSFRRYIVISNVVMIIILVSTTCRGAVLAAIALLFSYWYWTKYDRHKRKDRLLFASAVLLIASILVASFYSNYITTGRFDITYRLLNFTRNIPGLINSGRIWTGYGFVEKSVFSTRSVINNTDYTDNYFLYILMSTGIIGCLFILAVIIIIWKELSNWAKKNNFSRTARSIQAVNIMCLVFSLTEVTYLSPVSILSWISVILFLCYILAGDKAFLEGKHA